MEYGISNHIRLRVSLAVQLIDDFTDRAMTQTALVRIEGGYTPIRKPDGYYVFLNLTEKKTLLRVTSPQFSDYEEEIDLRLLDALEPVVKVRLLPNRCYPLPRGTTCIGGTAAPGSIIQIFCPEITGYLRLMKDYWGKKDGEICIFNPAQKDIEGKSFCIMDKDGRKMEAFTIGKAVNLEEERYSLQEMMEHSYEKKTARIYSMLLLKTDESGEFFAPVPFLEKEHPKALIRIRGSKKSMEIDLVYGTLNQIDLSERT